VPGQKFNYGVDFDAGRAAIYFGAWALASAGGCAAQRQTGSVHARFAEDDDPLNRQWRLTAMVDNLFNQNYQV